MSLVDGSGHASGVGTAVATAALLFGAGGAAAGTGTLPLAPGSMLLGPGGHAAGAAVGHAGANLVGVLAGLAAGLATVIGDYRVNASGHASGVGVLASAAGTMVHNGSGVAVGIGLATGRGGLVFIATGRSAGDGEASFDAFTDSDGAAHGLATVHGTGFRVLMARGYIFGTSKLVFCYPLPIFGRGTLTGNPVVDRVLPAINAIVGPSKCFRYLQHLQRGDLPIYISNHAGPVSPVRVAFTVFQVRPDGSRKQVGPSCRQPVQGVVGEFYATGRAGESGQPGEWIIRWEYQRTFQSAIQVKEMCFSVLDAVAARDPRDMTPRCRKYGWN